MTTCVLKAARVSVNWSLKNLGLGGTSEVSFTAHSSPHGSHHLLFWKPPGIGGKADVGHAWPCHVASSKRNPFESPAPSSLEHVKLL